MKLKKNLMMPDGTVLPKGTVLNFGNESVTNYKGKRISVYNIPTHAIEMVNNAIDPEDEVLPFDEVESGSRGTDVTGSPITILEKGVGRSGYDSLIEMFGEVSDLTFDELVNGYTDEEIDELEFVAYSTDADSNVKIGLFGADDVYATESTVNSCKAFGDVEPGDTGEDSSGKKFKVYAKGCGVTWLKQIEEENDLDLDHEALGDIDDDTELVYGAFANSNRTVVKYGSDGIKVN